MNTRRLTAVVVDDEPLAARRVARLLRKDPDVELMAVCTDPVKALTVIRKQHPQLALLDIQMPGMDGFALLRSLPEEAWPYVIFITAYNEHALQAFEFHALDYLLKPVRFDRLMIALNSAKKRIQNEEMSDFSRQVVAILSDLKDLKSGTTYRERFIVKSNERLLFVKVSEVDWIEAWGRYCRIYAGDQKYTIRESISSIEIQLDPRNFVRIHRSTIVNVDRIRELQLLFHGDYSVVLENGTRLTLSRTYRDKLDQLRGVPK